MQESLPSRPSPDNLDPYSHQYDLPQTPQGTPHSQTAYDQLPVSASEKIYTPGLVVSTNVEVQPYNEYAQALAQDIQTSTRTINGIPVISAGTFENFCMQAYYGNNAKIGKHNLENDFDTHSRATELIPFTIMKQAHTMWLDMGAPSEFQLVEMGAGTGDLARKFLEWANRSDPEFAQAVQYHIVELSAYLIQKQKDQLGEQQHKVTWHHGSALALPSELSHVRGMFLSTELIDAFKPETVTRSATGGLLQKFVGIQGQQWVEIWADADQDIADHIAHYGIPIEAGKQHAVIPDSPRFMHHIAERLEQGGVLTMDYGSTEYTQGSRNGRSPILTMRRGTISNQLFAEYQDIGEYDVSVNVSGAPLKLAATEASLQTEFLGTMPEMVQTGSSYIKDTLHNLYMTAHQAAARKESRYWWQQYEMAESIIKPPKENSSAYRFFFHVATKNVLPAIPTSYNGQ